MIMTREELNFDISASAFEELLSAQTPVDIYQAVLAEIDNYIESDGCAIALKINGSLQIIQIAGDLYGEDLLWTRLSSISYQHDVYQTGDSFLLGDITDTRSIPNSWRIVEPVKPRSHIQTFLCVPFSDFGVIFSVATTPHVFSKTDQEWLMQLSDYATSAFNQF